MISNDGLSSTPASLLCSCFERAAPCSPTTPRSLQRSAIGERKSKQLASSLLSCHITSLIVFIVRVHRSRAYHRALWLSSAWAHCAIIMRGQVQWLPRRSLLLTTLVFAFLVAFPLLSTGRLFRRAMSELTHDTSLKDSLGFSPETMSKRYEASAADLVYSNAFDCGHPTTCDVAALAKEMNGLPYSCKERIKYLMVMHGDSHLKACSAAVAGGACESECNPSHSSLLAEKSKLEQTRKDEMKLKKKKVYWIQATQYLDHLS